MSMSSSSMPSPVTSAFAVPAPAVAPAVASSVASVAVVVYYLWGGGEERRGREGRGVRKDVRKSGEEMDAGIEYSTRHSYSA